VTRLGKLFLVHEGETGTVLYFLFFFMIVSAGMAVGHGTADALFFKRFGIEYLPVMYIIQSLLLAMVSTLYAAFADRVPAESFFKVLLGILAALVAASWLIISRAGPSLIYPAYYLVYEVASELLLVHSALYMNQNMNTLQAKRLSPLIYAGAQVGTIAGGMLLAVFAPVIGTQNLVMAWCLLLVTGIVAVVLRHRRHGASVHFRAHARPHNLLQDCVLDI
jgi:ATP/ADP translocase